ncbi:MAG: hypothetical protein ACI9FJ_000336 [Alteromonadaceae bacterium]|jgi:uncharacterized protein (DUF885 family)
MAPRITIHGYARALALTLIASLGLTLLSACQAIKHEATITPAQAATTQLDSLSAQAWQSLLSFDPIEANQSDSNDYNDRLKDLSPESLADYNQKFTTYVKKLNAINRQLLSDEQNISLEILIRKINNDISKYRFKHHYTPIKAESGFHTQVAYLPRIMPFNSKADFENYIIRLKAIPRFFEQNIYWMKQGISAGITQPQAVLTGFEVGINTFIVDDAKTSLYYGPFTQKRPVGITEAQFNQLKGAAVKVIKQAVIPAYQDFYHFMVDTYIPQARKTTGLAAIPDGVEYYTNRVKYFTTTDLTPEQVHRVGLREVARIRGEMDQIIKKLEFKGSFAQFVDFLRTDKQFYATSPEQLIKEAAYIAKKMDAKLPKLFKHLPRTPYGVEAVPEHLAPKYTTGRYISSSQDDQPGYYWVNTYRLDRRPLYVLEALTLHEAVPGHHLQNSIARELTNVPAHRRFAYISAFGEGWGLYSEFLGIEAGFYQDPYSDFGRLTYEMWRACRLVVDTGMHIKGWSRQKAMDFLQSNTALSVHNVKTEIDRYIAWPGQALSYKMGELTIKRLRLKAEKKLGSKFDIREFHDEVLKHGPLPLKVLEKQIDAYIKKVVEQGLNEK